MQRAHCIDSSEGRRGAPEIGDLVAVVRAGRRSGAGRWQLSHGHAEEAGAGYALQGVPVSTSPANKQIGSSTHNKKD